MRTGCDCSSDQTGVNTRLMKSDISKSVRLFVFYFTGNNASRPNFPQYLFPYLSSPLKGKGTLIYSIICTIVRAFILPSECFWCIYWLTIVIATVLQLAAENTVAVQKSTLLAGVLKVLFHFLRIEEQRRRRFSHFPKRKYVIL